MIQNKIQQNNINLSFLVPTLGARGLLNFPFGD